MYVQIGENMSPQSKWTMAGASPAVPAVQAARSKAARRRGGIVKSA